MAPELPPQDPKLYEQDRRAAYDRILALVDAHIDAIPPSVTLNLEVLALTATQQMAERECWTLFRAGVAHLKDGGWRGAPGELEDAVSKASLRNSSTARGLALKAPEFMQEYYELDHASGDLEALFFCRRLLEAAAADADKSAKMIQRAVGLGTVPLSAPADTVEDRELARVFAAVRKTGAALPDMPHPEAPPGMEALEAAVRKQAMLMAKMLPEAYKGAAEKLQAEMTALYTRPEVVPPPPAPPKGGSFDL
jgi:hypothetical protein